MNLNPSIMHPATAARASALATNKVLCNTCSLLSMTLLFSAGTAGASLALNLPHPGLLLTLAGYVGLLFATVSLHAHEHPIGISRDETAGSFNRFMDPDFRGTGTLPANRTLQFLHALAEAVGRRRRRALARLPLQVALVFLPAGSPAGWRIYAR